MQSAMFYYADLGGKEEVLQGGGHWPVLWVSVGFYSCKLVFPVPCFEFDSAVLGS